MTIYNFPFLSAVVVFAVCCSTTVFVAGVDAVDSAVDGDGDTVVVAIDDASSLESSSSSSSSVRRKTKSKKAQGSDNVFNHTTRKKSKISKKASTQPPQTPDDHGGYGGYPRVNIKNKTKVAASGMVTYRGSYHCKGDLYHVNPGETWTAPTDRGICLVVCVLANPDVPIPLNIAEAYHSSGTSYAEFEIVFDVDEARYVVQRPGGNIPGKHIWNCDTKGPMPDYQSPACTDRYHNPWPPTIPGKCNEDPLRTSKPTVQPTEAPPPTEKPTMPPTAAPQLTKKPTVQPTKPRTPECPSGSNKSQPWNGCTQYYSCVNGKSGPVQDCPSSLLFDTDTGYVIL